MIVEKLRKQIQRSPVAWRPVIGLITIICAAVLSPILILWQIGDIVWDTTFGDDESPKIG